MRYDAQPSILHICSAGIACSPPPSPSCSFSPPLFFEIVKLGIIALLVSLVRALLKSGQNQTITGTRSVRVSCRTSMLAMVGGHARSLAHRPARRVHDFQQCSSACLTELCSGVLFQRWHGSRSKVASGESGGWRRGRGGWRDRRKSPWEGGVRPGVGRQRERERERLSSNGIFSKRRTLESLSDAANLPLLRTCPYLGPTTPQPNSTPYTPPHTPFTRDLRASPDARY